MSRSVWSITVFHALIVAQAALLCAPVWAVNKCTGPDGRVSFQDTACAITAKSSEKVKIWGSEGGKEGYTLTKPVGLPAVIPNAKLTGPPGSEALVGLYRRWADAEKLAMSTGRIALAAPAANLQTTSPRPANRPTLVIWQSWVGGAAPWWWVMKRPPVSDRLGSPNK
jgi:hypothetical protein